MYICLNTTENTPKILKMFEEHDISLEISAHPHFTFIRADQTEMKAYSGYVALYSNCLRYHDLTGEGNDFEIPFSELNTIYEL